MSPRVGSKIRCPRCLMSGITCLCPILPRIETRTRVVVLMHCRETQTSTNTARIACLMLPNSEIRLRGVPGQPMSEEGLILEDREPLLLFPSPDSVELTPDLVSGFSKPPTLIVPDGSWRQCHKVPGRVPALKQARRVKLPPGPPSRYLLRTEPHPHMVSTLEAIARALGVLEGPEVRRQMEDLFDIMVERTLWARGKIPTSECRSLPPGAVTGALLPPED
jgi:DTW domain-containing protein YfiP